MKLLRAAIMVLFTAGILFLGMSLIWMFFAEKGLFSMPYDFAGFVQTITVGPWNWRLGIVLVLIGAGIILLKVREIRREQCIAFDNPEGEVAISMDAVEDFIVRIGNSFPNVKSLVPAIHAGPEGIGVVIRMDLWSGSNIPRLSEDLQNAIKSRVQDTLGINVNYISVSVGKIVGGEKEGEMEGEESLEE